MDLRKDAPYLAYGELEFEVPVGIKGDNYDRYYVRMCEIDESISMIRQCVSMLPERPDQRRRPARDAAREGDRLHADRSADPSLQARHGRHSRAAGRDLRRRTRRRTASSGFYLVSDGGTRPYKLHIRSPSFVHMGGMHTLLEGYQVADIVPDVRLDEHDRRGVRPMSALTRKVRRR